MQEERPRQLGGGEVGDVGDLRSGESADIAASHQIDGNRASMHAAHRLACLRIVEHGHDLVRLAAHEVFGQIVAHCIDRLLHDDRKAERQRQRYSNLGDDDAGPQAARHHASTSRQ